MIKLPRRYISPAPKPSDHENELLTILIEECAEVTQRATKAQRFGLAEKQPGQRLSNAQRLAREIGDVLALVDEVLKHRLILRWDIEMARKKKPAKLRRYMQHRPPKRVGPPRRKRA